MNIDDDYILAVMIRKKITRSNLYAVQIQLFLNELIPKTEYT